MADRKHWFHMSHDVNSDHEVWEMTENIGDRSLRIWIEFLSISDRCKGFLPVWSDTFASTVGRKCHSTPAKVRQVWDHAHAKVWMVSDPIPRVVNHAKYHPTRSLASDPPPIPPIPSEPIKIKNEEPASPEPSAHTQNQSNGIPIWHEVAERIYRSNKERFKSLFGWANGISRSGHFTEGQIRDTLINFESFEQRNGSVDEWYPYLKTVLQKTKVRSNARAAELRNAAFKKEESKWGENLKNGKTTPRDLVSGIASRLAGKR